MTTGRECAERTELGSEGSGVGVGLEVGVSNAEGEVSGVIFGCEKGRLNSALSVLG